MHLPPLSFSKPTLYSAHTSKKSLSSHLLVKEWENHSSLKSSSLFWQLFYRKLTFLLSYLLWHLTHYFLRHLNYLRDSIRMHKQNHKLFQIQNAPVVYVTFDNVSDLICSFLCWTSPLHILFRVLVFIDPLWSSFFLINPSNLARSANHSTWLQCLFSDH